MSNGDSVWAIDRAFELYDTFGFPLDLTQILTRENGIVVDEQRFKDKMVEQQERSRSSWKAAGKNQDSLILGEILKENGGAILSDITRTSYRDIVAIIQGQEVVSEATVGEQVRRIRSNHLR